MFCTRFYYTFLLIFITFHITIHNCYYLLPLPKTQLKTKDDWYTSNIKVQKNNELMKVGIKDHMCKYFDDIIQVESLILIISYQTKNRMKIFLFMTFHAKP